MKAKKVLIHDSDEWIEPLYSIKLWKLIRRPAKKRPRWRKVAPGYESIIIPDSEDATNA